MSCASAGGNRPFSAIAIARYLPLTGDEADRTQARLR